jgi:hypothetical protein
MLRVEPTLKRGQLQHDVHVWHIAVSVADFMFGVSFQFACHAPSAPAQDGPDVLRLSVRQSSHESSLIISLLEHHDRRRRGRARGGEVGRYSESQVSRQYMSVFARPRG